MILGDKDSIKFRNQFIYGKPKKAAIQAIKRGNEMLNEYNKNGFVRITLWK